MKKSYKYALMAIAVPFFIAASGFAAAQDGAARELFPEAGAFTAKKCGDIYYLEASRDNKAAGYCINVTAKGYGGPIYMVVGVEPAGTIRGIRILSHSETPGIGAAINEVSSVGRTPWFLAQFTGKRAGAIRLKKDVDAVSGATVSSAAVTNAVNECVAEFLSRLKAAG
ncbi:MAG: FMN-binding protein [Candidatus Omnitrophota bacterium]